MRVFFKCTEKRMPWEFNVFGSVLQSPRWGVEFGGRGRVRLIYRRAKARKNLFKGLCL